MHGIGENNELETARSPVAPSMPRKRKSCQGEMAKVRHLRTSREPCAQCRLKKINASKGHHFITADWPDIFWLVVTDYSDIITLV
jgi:hypothetical protein